MLSIVQRVEQLPELRLRASAGGDLAAAVSRLTDKQTKDLEALLTKTTPPTPLQMETIRDLKFKRDNPELSDGAKTFVNNWLWENLRQKRMELNTKELAKGIIVEDDSIDLAERALGWDFALKNEKHFENKFFTGTPDLFIKINKLDYVVDIKSSWDERTFKYFSPAYDKGYMYQLQIYMELTGIRNASLVFVLTNTPLHLIRKEAINYCYTFGYEIPADIEDSEIYAMFLDKMTYDDLPDEMRVKKFDFHYDGFVINNLTEGVKAARIHKNELVEKKFGIKLV